MTVLVTGAMGQVGPLVVDLLLDSGRKVVATDLPTDAARAVARRWDGHPGLTVAYADVTDAAATHELVSAHAPEAVVHLAAVVSPPCYRDKALARRVNVGGTGNLVAAAQALAAPPVFVLASSAAVYGARNPYTAAGRITPETPADPVECYGHQKVEAEALVRASGLRHAVLRLGGVASPKAPTGPDYLVLMRSLPRDTRVHMVDARDVALAFVRAVERIDAVDGRTLLIGGDESFVLRHTEVQDDMFAAMGLGRPGPALNLPGDPADDRGWSFTDWYDTAESQQLLGYQQHRWSDTLSWVRNSLGRKRFALVAAGPVARPLLRAGLAVQRRRDGRGAYADPWRLIAQVYGEEVLAP